MKNLMFLLFRTGVAGVPTSALLGLIYMLLSGAFIGVFGGNQLLGSFLPGAAIVVVGFLVGLVWEKIEDKEDGK